MPPTVQKPPSPSAPKKPAPVMPRIPGVNDKPAGAQVQLKPLIGVIAGVLLCAVVFAVWLSHRRRGDQELSASATAAAPEVVISDSTSTTKTEMDPDVIAKIDELAKPWSSKKFDFVDPQSHDSAAAIAIRLPGAGASFWAFSLNTPFSRCQLQYVTDLSALSQRFAYPATHPMVVSECDGTIYDPLKMATLSDGSWARGDIVRGGGIRPPIAIQVQVRGHELVAARMER
jgi:hypothetical protein